MSRVLVVSGVGAALIVLVSGAQTPPTEDKAVVQAALTEYLETVAYPAPKPIDPMLFADDIEAFWSNGKTHRGRDAMVKAMEEGVRELEADFESFAAKADDVHIHRRGDFAWVTCHIKLNGTLTEDRGSFSRTIRSSFVFEKRDDRWQMVHEHSGRLPKQTP